MGIAVLSPALTGASAGCWSPDLTVFRVLTLVGLFLALNRSPTEVGTLNTCNAGLLVADLLSHQITASATIQK